MVGKGVNVDKTREALPGSGLPSTGRASGGGIREAGRQAGATAERPRCCMPSSVDTVTMDGDTYKCFSHNRPHMGALPLVMHGGSGEIYYTEMSPLYLANEDISLFAARLPAGVVRYELQAAASCGRPPCCVPSL